MTTLGGLIIIIVKIIMINDKWWVACVFVYTGKHNNELLLERDHSVMEIWCHAQRLDSDSELYTYSRHANSSWFHLIAGALLTDIYGSHWKPIFRGLKVCRCILSSGQCTQCSSGMCWCSRLYWTIWLVFTIQQRDSFKAVCLAQ